MDRVWNDYSRRITVAIKLGCCTGKRADYPRSTERAESRSLRNHAVTSWASSHRSEPSRDAREGQTAKGRGEEGANRTNGAAAQPVLNGDGPRLQSRARSKRASARSGVSGTIRTNRYGPSGGPAYSAPG